MLEFLLHRSFLKNVPVSYCFGKDYFNAQVSDGVLSRTSPTTQVLFASGSPVISYSLPTRHFSGSSQISIFSVLTADGCQYQVRVRDTWEQRKWYTVISHVSEERWRNLRKYIQPGEYPLL